MDLPFESMPAGCEAYGLHVHFGLCIGDGACGPGAPDSTWLIYASSFIPEAFGRLEFLHVFIQFLP